MSNETHLDTSEPKIELLRFYVYELRDPRNNEVFYVGKGQRNRVNQHKGKVPQSEGQASTDSILDDIKNENPEDDDSTRLAKVARIAEIESAGHEVLRIIVGRFSNEDEAFAVESTLIKWIYGFGNLTNLVHGHRHQYIRDQSQKATRQYAHVEGIDIPRRLIGLRDGTYTQGQLDSILNNSIFEKLDSLRQNLLLQQEFAGMTISDPDLSRPQDPCLVVTGLQPREVSLIIKMQLTGKNVILGLRPKERGKKGSDDFKAALTNIRRPFDIKKSSGNDPYAQTHDFKTNAEGMSNGVPYGEIRKICRLFDETKARLNG